METSQSENISKIDDKEYQRISDFLKEIGTEERHFNDLSSKYKALASTWLLSTFAGVGFILSGNIEPKNLYISGIGFAGGIGILLLWLIDLRVYQQLLNANFVEALKLEKRYSWIPPVRNNMIDSMLGGSVVYNLVWFYLLGVLVPLFIGAYALSSYLAGMGILYFAPGVIALSFVIIILLRIITKNINEESLKKYLGEKSSLTRTVFKFFHLWMGAVFFLISSIVFFPGLTPMSQAELTYETQTLAPDYDYLAPDKSEIRLLPELHGGGMAHCLLPVGATSQAVKHKSVEEIWYVLEGHGELWRKNLTEESVVALLPGVSITIPVGTHFQFRNIGQEDLKIIISTMPPWPGSEEAIEVKGFW